MTAPAGEVPGTVWDYPDGGHAMPGPDGWPVVTVRFPDGGQADFRTGSEWPHTARILYRGLTVNGLAVDVDASVDQAGTAFALSVWKTGVAGVDGGNDIPAKVLSKVSALARRRSREARVAARVAAGGRKPVLS